MSKYFRLITEGSKLEKRSGSSVVLPIGFQDTSSHLVSACTYQQHLLQQIIFITHGAELLEAKRTLRTFSSPKARIDFLCTYPYSGADPVVSTVFEHARRLFRDLYELRNILCHEVWSTSDAHPNSVIFSSLDQEARLLLVSGRVWHADDATSQEVYDATIRYIRHVKVISVSDLNQAKIDADLCSWILVHIGTILNESDASRREEARKLFLHFRGTSHLFGAHPATSGTMTFRASRNKEIEG